MKPSAWLALIRRRAGGQSTRNAAVSGLSAMVNPVVQFVATPVIFHHLGAASFGIWALITSVIAVSGLASMGLGEAATKYVALYRARRDPSGVLRIVRGVWTLYLVLGAVTALGVFFAAPWIAGALFHLEGEMLAGATAALRVAALGIVIRFFYGVAEAAVRGYERYDVESTWTTLNSVSASVAALISVWLGGGLVEVVWVGVITTLVCAVGLGFALTRLAGSAKWAVPHVDRATIREVMGFGVFSWLQNVNGMVMLQLDRVVIGAWLGAAAAGYYSVCLQLVQTAHGVLSRASGFIFPLVVKHREEGNRPALWRLFKDGLLLTTIAGWLFSSVFVVFGHQFLALWMGAEFAAASGPLLVLLGVYNAFLATSIVPFYFLNATGREKQNTVLVALSTASFLGAAFFLIRAVGLIGAPLARLFTIWAGLVSRTVVIRTLTGDRRWSAGLVTLAPPAAAVLIVGAVDRLVPAPLVSSWIVRGLTWLGASAVCVGASLWVYRSFFGREVDRVVEDPAIPMSLELAEAARGRET